MALTASIRREPAILPLIYVVRLARPTVRTRLHQCPEQLLTERSVSDGPPGMLDCVPETREQRTHSTGVGAAGLEQPAQPRRPALREVAAGPLPGAARRPRRLRAVPVPTPSPSNTAPIRLRPPARVAAALDPPATRVACPPTTRVACPADYARRLPADYARRLPADYARRLPADYARRLPRRLRSPTPKRHLTSRPDHLSTLASATGHPPTATSLRGRSPEGDISELEKRGHF